MLLELPQLKAIAALTLLSPFVPLLFQGEEWGAKSPFLYFTNHLDSELGRLVAEGRSREFGAFAWEGTVPNPQEKDTFERSKLDWSELNGSDHAELYEWYRRLIEIRRTRSNILQTVPPDLRCDAEAGWLTMRLGNTLAVFNLAAHAQRVEMPSGEWELVLSSDARDSLASAELPGHVTRVYHRPA
jgi:maltooligosyltrehalose trehalohydrolase